MIEWLIEKILMGFGVIAFSAFLVSLYTFMIAPCVAIFGALAVADLTRIKRRWKILIVLVPSIYFLGGLIMGYLMLAWMCLPDI